MTAAPHPGPRIRPVPDRRPPAITFAAAAPSRPADDQPPLDLHSGSLDQSVTPVVPEDVRARVVQARWCATPRPELPEIRAWAGSFVVAVVEVLHGRRAVTQLGRWVNEDVFFLLTTHQRRRPHPRQRVPPTLRSMRIQHPHPEVAEVAVVLEWGSRLGALALRLEARGGRWVCSQLEVGPRVGAQQT